MAGQLNLTLGQPMKLSPGLNLLRRRASPCTHCHNHPTSDASANDPEPISCTAVDLTALCRARSTRGPGSGSAMSGAARRHCRPKLLEQPQGMQSPAARSSADASCTLAAFLQLRTLPGDGFTWLTRCSDAATPAASPAPSGGLIVQFSLPAQIQRAFPCSKVAPANSCGQQSLSNVTLGLQLTQRILMQGL